MKFYEGSISYEYGKTLPIEELISLQRDAQKIIQEIKKN
jgi:hypothetical protein